MNNFHISLAHKRIGLHGNLPFFIGMLKDSTKILQTNKSYKILDFGCGDGSFLQIADLFLKVEFALGIDLQEDMIETANKTNKFQNIKYDTLKALNNKNYNKFFDLCYSQEVLYTIKDLDAHAKMIYEILKPNAFYFATIGSYIGNPLWGKRRDIIRKEEKYYAYDYTLDEIAKIFSKNGFEVGIKKLTMDYFAIYDEDTTQAFSNSLLDLVNHCSDYKMLFCFYKK